MGSTRGKRTTSRSGRRQASGGQGRKKSSAAKSRGSEESAHRAAITNYTTALRWLDSHTDYERLRSFRYNQVTFSLDRMHQLLSLLGNPERELSCIQVAGTKGKGSCCAMLSSMLEACGYTTGLYTSPHLTDLRERITIGGRMAGYQPLTEIFRAIADAEAQLEAHLTYFEILTAAALRHFADQAVDVAVLEVGMGGRLDSTTAVTPMVCGMTQISYDHMNVLGRDLASIAREKAGIFKNDVPAVSVAQPEEARPVLDEAAGDAGTPLAFTDRDIEFSYRFEASRELGPHTRVSITTDQSQWEHLAVPLRGEHQAHNCALALSILDRLKARGFEIPASEGVRCM
jgi:dihydrofolate synthase/folylpolyglutamate synthase